VSDTQQPREASSRDEAASPDGSASTTTPSVTEPSVTEPSVTEPSTVTIRRSPRYFRFLLLGVILGALAALIPAFGTPESAEFSRGQVFGFFLLMFGTVGLAVGATVALLLDRAWRRRVGTGVIAREEHTEE